MNITDKNIVGRIEFLHEILDIKMQELELIEFDIAQLFGALNELESILQALNHKEVKTNGNRTNVSRRGKRTVRRKGRGKR